MLGCVCEDGAHTMPNRGLPPAAAAAQAARLLFVRTAVCRAWADSLEARTGRDGGARTQTWQRERTTPKLTLSHVARRHCDGRDGWGAHKCHHHNYNTHTAWHWHTTTNIAWHRAVCVPPPPRTNSGDAQSGHDACQPIEAAARLLPVATTAAAAATAHTAIQVAAQASSSPSCDGRASWTESTGGLGRSGRAVAAAV
jgi:hypothetical protein